MSSLSLKEARDRLLAALDPLPSEIVPIASARGRYSAAQVTSPIDLPRFDNSAMDGYAIRSIDNRNLPQKGFVRLQVVGSSPAGHCFPGPVEPGQCVRIFTGSPLPSGTDAVVMQEDVERVADADQIELKAAVRPWENVRFAGEDLKRGAVLLNSGERIRIAHLVALGATGIAHVSVGCAPRIAVIATGDELRSPGEELEHGQIFESNAIVLAELLRQAGARVDVFPYIPDSPLEVGKALAKAMESNDGILTIGGASVGEHDYVKSAVEQLGGTIDFWKVSMKPGRPFFFGRCNGKSVFGVPGNPVSAFVTTVLLVMPAMARLQGASVSIAEPSSIAAILSESLVNDGERPHFVRVRTDANSRVASAGVQASHITGSLSKADGLVEVPPRTTLPIGAVVSVIRWEW